MLRLSFLYSRPVRELLAGLSSVELTELIAADRMGLVPDTRREVFQDEEPQDMADMYEQHKAQAAKR